MLRLVDPGLPSSAMAKLVEWQAEVDNSGDYATRVGAAKRRFAARSSSATFRVVRQTLSRMCSGAQRCAYCEDSVGDEVEHLLPKDLYPEQVFVWENYVFSCGPCNGGKRNKFAVIQNGQLRDITRRRNDPITPPPNGQPAFINPRSENPEELLELELSQTFMFLPREELNAIDKTRADYTINFLKLNRDVLLRARENAYGSYRARLVEYIEMRDAGCAEEKLAALIDGIESMPHPAVWAEMRRQHALLPDLRNLFNVAPEALVW